MHDKTRLGGAVGLLVAAFACGPNTDVTVPPPPKPEAQLRAEVPPPLDSGRLVPWLKPVRYAIELDVDPKADRFSGKVTIDVSLDRPTRAFVLHASKLDILEAHVLAGDDKVAATTKTRKSAGSPGPKEELVVLADEVVSLGEVQLVLSFAGPLEEGLAGIHRVVDEGKSYVFTQFEPSDARRMFPCFDDPIYKVPFQATITVPKGNLAFFNTPEKSRSEDNGKITFTFAQSKRMPTYLVALAIGPLEVVEGAKTPVPIRVITKPGAGKLAGPALKMAEEHLRELERYFGSPYPYAKLDLVAVPNFGAGAMENAGLIAFREELLLFDEKTATAKTKRDVAMTVAHELAHHWFGNLVTMKWWDDLWLNEGFATFMEGAIVDRWRPEMEARLELLSLTGRVMDFDALTSARAVRNPVANTYQAMEAFDGITYIKGAAFVHMLQSWLGDDAFRTGLASYMSQHAWGNASADDLFAAFARTSGKKVAETAKTFLEAPGVPLVHAELACGGDLPPRVRLTQSVYSGRVGGDEQTGQEASETDEAAPPAPRIWHIPVCITYGKRGAKTVQRDCTLLTEPTREVALTTKECPDWSMPNADYAGYYRYAMPRADWLTLAKRTRKESTAENIGFLTNAWALVQGGQLEAVDLFDVLLTYKKETRRQVLEELIKVLAHISDALVEPKGRAGFERMVTALLQPTAKRLGWDAKERDSEDDRLLRGEVLAAMSLLTDDAWMAREARKRALAFMADPSSVEAASAKIALKHAARKGELGLTALKAKLAEVKTAPQRIALVEALASQHDAANLRGAFNLILSGDIRAQDGVYVARAAAETETTRSVLIAWLGENLEAVSKKMPGFGVARMLRSARHICDSATRETAANSLRPALEKLGRSGRRLDEALEASSLCIDLRKRQASAATGFFTEKRRY